MFIDKNLLLNILEHYYKYGVNCCRGSWGAAQLLLQMNPRTLGFYGAELLKDAAVGELLEAGIDESQILELSGSGLQNAAAVWEQLEAP